MAKGTDQARVLIVDDEEVIRYVFESLLEDSGYDVRSVESAEEGLKMFDEWVPDLAIVDILLPGIDGMELLRELKIRFPESEVIVMSGHAAGEAALQSIRLGAFEFLQKPFNDLDSIKQTVEDALSKRFHSKGRRSAHVRTGTGR